MQKTKLKKVFRFDFLSKALGCLKVNQRLEPTLKSFVYVQKGRGLMATPGSFSEFRSRNFLALESAEKMLADWSYPH